MSLVIALEALKVSYRDQSKWLLTQAVEFDARRITVLSHTDGAERDITLQTAIDYRSRAVSLEGISHSYEMLDAGEAARIGKL
jgi:isocitrate dehydrogenase kinase/phosphatase